MRYTLYTKPSHSSHKGEWATFPNASLQYDEQQNAVVNQSGTPYDIDKSLDNGILIGKGRSGDKIAAVPETHPAFNMIFFHKLLYDYGLGSRMARRAYLLNLLTITLNKLTNI